MSVGDTPSDKPEDVARVCIGTKSNKTLENIIVKARKEIETDAQDWVGVSKKNAKSGCFPAHATVRGQHGERIKMADLIVGQKVHGSSSLDQVTNFIHTDTKLEASFLKLVTDRGMLELTPNHLVFLGMPDSSRKAVMAQFVSIGDTLLHRDGPARVTGVESFKSHGVYAPLTRRGEMEVNGFHTSCYASFPSHTAAHMMMQPLHYLPVNAHGVHWYARGWQRMYEAAQWLVSKL